MEKIICDLCGTSYPENTDRCPICGSARPAKAKTAPSADGDSGGYTYVKGGRFSSANVHRRNSERGTASEQETSWEANERTLDKARLVSYVAIIALFILIAVLLFFIIKIVNDRANPEVDSYPETTQQMQEDDSSVNCVSLHTNDVETTFTKAGEKWQIKVTPEPTDTSDRITYTSMDPEIAAVDSEGLVTGLAYGQTSILVKCGKASLLITVKCTFDDGSGQQWSLNRKEFTLSGKGESWDLYSKNSTVAKNKIKWTTDDPAVATVEDGIVTAVGPGTTTVHAEYNDTVYSCTVHCNVKTEGGEDQDKDNEDKDDQDKEDDKPEVDPAIDLDTLKISHLDVTIKVGEAFNLVLKDADGDVAKVNWFVSRAGFVAIYGNTVKGLTSTGNDFVTVRCVYGGETYACKVYVK